MKAEILLIAWRRPHTVREVLAAIRAYAPPRLFIACDGPSTERPGEAEKVAATRAVIENEIDWPCRVERLYSDVNQGCSVGPQRAISWFFDHVEEGIILEDDCVPHADFFPYCEQLLERYRHDERIWCISGTNFQDGQWHGDGSYYFSHNSHTWGWASWRRCWQRYDPLLLLWPKLRDSGLLTTIFSDPLERSFWSDLWQQTYEKKGDVSWWDYQWTFLCMSNSGLSILPNRNLVSNIGFGSDATHTTSGSNTLPPVRELPSIQPPRFMLINKTADQYFVARYLVPMLFTPSPIDKVATRLKNGVKKVGRAVRSLLHPSLLPG